MKPLNYPGNSRRQAFSFHTHTVAFSAPEGAQSLIEYGRKINRGFDELVSTSFHVNDFVDREFAGWRSDFSAVNQATRLIKAVLIPINGGDFVKRDSHLRVVDAVKGKRTRAGRIQDNEIVDSRKQGRISGGYFEGYLVVAGERLPERVSKGSVNRDGITGVATFGALFPAPTNGAR